MLQLQKDPVVVATFVTGNVGRRDGAIGALSVVNAVEDGDLCCDVGDDVFSDLADNVVLCRVGSSSDLPT